MRFITLLTSVILIPCILLAAAFSLRKQALKPESKILGKWEEVSWTYAKADNQGAVHFGDEPLPQAMKHLISASKIIHRAEQWNFNRNARLQLHAPDKAMTVDWSILGSSSILRLRYNDEYEEAYDLVELTDKRMVLHFESDKLTRGIVRITFQRS